MKFSKNLQMQGTVLRNNSWKCFVLTSIRKFAKVQKTFIIYQLNFSKRQSLTFSLNLIGVFLLFRILGEFTGLYKVTRHRRTTDNSFSLAEKKFTSSLSYIVTKICLSFTLTLIAPLIPTLWRSFLYVRFRIYFTAIIVLLVCSFSTAPHPGTNLLHQ